jgi:hypothetical protein
VPAAKPDAAVARPAEYRKLAGNRHSSSIHHATEAEALENIRSAIEEYLGAVNDSLKSERVREVEVAV